MFSHHRWKVAARYLAQEKATSASHVAARYVEAEVLTKSARIAADAKYKGKKEVPKADGKGTTTVYEYSERQVQHRNREKAKRIEKLRPQIAKLREEYKKDLEAGDPKVRLTALAIALIDETYERVGNAESAEEGHFGVTGWQKKHLTFSKDKAFFRYVGKSGVKQEKTVQNPKVLRALREAVKNLGPDDRIMCDTDADCDVKSEDVNRYLKKFEVTAKDLRGFHANREMQTRLKALRGAGKKLPEEKKEKEDLLKKEFKQALEETAEVVGHEPTTLKSQYLVPGMEEDYLKDGTVDEKLNKKAASLQMTDEIPEGEDPWRLAQESGIHISRNKDFKIGFVDGDQLVAAMFDAVDDDCYAFDTVVHPAYRSKGLGSRLIDAAIREYRDLEEAMPDIKFCLDVVNPVAMHILKTRGFVETGREQGHVLMTRVGTRTPAEREDDETSRLVRPMPKKKPPRKDLRRERMDVEDKDTTPAGADTDKDMSLNYKKVARRLAFRWLAIPSLEPSAEKVAYRVLFATGGHKPGDIWKAEETGRWVSMNQDGVAHAFGDTPEDRERAESYAQGGAKGPASEKEVAEDEKQGVEGEAEKEEPVAPPIEAPEGPKTELETYSKIKTLSVEEAASEASAYFKNDFAQALAPGAFSDEEDFARQLQSATLKYMPPEELSKALNTKLGEVLEAGERAYDVAKAKAVEEGTDSEVVSRELEAGEPVSPAVAIQDKTGRLFLVSGDNRLRVALAKGKQLPVKIIEYSGEFKEETANKRLKELAQLSNKAGNEAEQILREFKEKSPFSQEMQTALDRWENSLDANAFNTLSEAVKGAVNGVLAKATVKGHFDEEAFNKAVGALGPYKEADTLEKVPESIDDVGKMLASVHLRAKEDDIKGYQEKKEQSKTKEEAKAFFEGIESKADRETVKKSIKGLGDLVSAMPMEDQKTFAESITTHLDELRRRVSSGYMDRGAIERASKALTKGPDITVIHDPERAGLHIASYVFAKELTNPKRFKGMPLSSLKKNDKELKGRATEALGYYNDMNEVLRKEALNQLHAAMQNTMEGPEKEDLKAIGQGLTLASMLHDEPPGNTKKTYREDPDTGDIEESTEIEGLLVGGISVQLSSLAKKMHSLGQDDILLDTTSETGVYTPKSRAAINRAIGKMDDEELVEFAGGPDGDFSIMIELMNDPSLDDDMRAFAKEILRSMVTDDMSFGAMIRSTANELERPLLPSSKKELEEVKKSGMSLDEYREVGRHKETVRHMTYENIKVDIDDLASCLEKAKSVEDREACRKKFDNLRIKHLQSALDTAEKAAGGDALPEDPVIIQARHAIELNDPKELDFKYEIQKPSGTDKTASLELEWFWGPKIYQAAVKSSGTLELAPWKI